MLFTAEHREKLQAEHKFVSATITRLTVTNFKQYAQQHGPDIITAAASNLKARKVELEAQIDLIAEFLE